MRDRIVKFKISEQLGNFVHFDFILDDGEEFSGLVYYFDYIINCDIYYKDGSMIELKSPLWYKLSNCLILYNIECLRNGKDLIGNNI